MRRPLSPQQKELVETVVGRLYNKTGRFPTSADLNQLAAAGIFDPEMEQAAQEMVLNTIRNAPTSYGDGRTNSPETLAKSIPTDLFLNAWISRLNRMHADWVNAGSPNIMDAPEFSHPSGLPF